MNNFGKKSGKLITKGIIGKTISKCEVLDEGMDNILQFQFADGSSLHFRYDWIYEWELIGATWESLGGGFTEHEPDQTYEAIDG